MLLSNFSYFDSECRTLVTFIFRKHSRHCWHRFWHRRNHSFKYSFLLFFAYSPSNTKCKPFSNVNFASCYLLMPMAVVVVAFFVRIMLFCIFFCVINHIEQTNFFRRLPRFTHKINHPIAILFTHRADCVSVWIEIIITKWWHLIDISETERLAFFLSRRWQRIV